MASFSPEGDEVAEILRFAQDDRNPVCRESTTPPRPIRFAHRARHPSCPGGESFADVHYRFMLQNQMFF